MKLKAEYFTVFLLSFYSKILENTSFFQTFRTLFVTQLSLFSETCKTTAAVRQPAAIFDNALPLEQSRSLAAVVVFRQ